MPLILRLFPQQAEDQMKEVLYIFRNIFTKQCVFENNSFLLQNVCPMLEKLCVCRRRKIRKPLSLTITRQKSRDNL